MVKIPLTHTPTITICFVILRILPKDFIYGKLWTKLLDGFMVEAREDLEDDSFDKKWANEKIQNGQKCAQILELINQNAITANQSQEVLTLFDWCHDKIFCPG